jgi:hypothetical protein
MNLTRILTTLGLLFMIAVGGAAYESAVAAQPKVAADTGWDTPTPAPGH